MLAKKRSHAADELFNDIILAGHHRRQIDCELPDIDPMPRKLILRRKIALGRIKQRLAGDAADIQTCPAQVFALDACDLAVGI